MGSNWVVSMLVDSIIACVLTGTMVFTTKDKKQKELNFLFQIMFWMALSCVVIAIVIIAVNFVVGILRS